VSTLSTRWQARILWLLTVPGTIAIGFVIRDLVGDNDPRLLLALLVAAGGFVVSRFWPRCPHCGARAIRNRADWLFPGPGPECMVCGQRFDELPVNSAELDRRAIGALVEGGRLPPGSLERFEQIKQEAQAEESQMERLRSLAARDPASARQLASLLERALRDHEQCVADLQSAGMMSPDDRRFLAQMITKRDDVCSELKALQSGGNARGA
jgi:hypothetical protein